MTIEIYSDIDIDEQTPRLIEKCAKAVLEHENIKFEALIDITITSNEEIRRINKEFRQKDYATDVLSFPMVTYKNGNLLENLAFCTDPDTGLVHLGDMLISFDKVLEQAKEYGHSNEREFAFLTVHSVLHLLGYDHETNDEDKTLMRAKEKAILEGLGILRV